MNSVLWVLMGWLALSLAAGLLLAACANVRRRWTEPFSSASVGPGGQVPHLVAVPALPRQRSQLQSPDGFGVVS
jgi:hypothetical protein